MPKQKAPKKLTDKQKIRLLEQEIKDMKRDFKETFSVLDDDKPKKKSGGTLIIPVIAIAVIFLLAAAYIFMNLI